MIRTLKHIREKYGSLPHYLSSVSFPLHAQETLVSLMIEDRSVKHKRRMSKGILPRGDGVGVGVPGNVGVGEVVEEILDPMEE